MSSPLEIPDNVSFESAIALTQRMMEQLPLKQLEAPLQETVAKLVSTRNGARGFFVAYLTDAVPLADNPDPEIVEALRQEPEQVSELLVKNLAMSTAMEMAHQRNGQPDQAQQSARVSRRSADLIKRVGGEPLRTEAEALWEAIAKSTGSYTLFLKKWGYDAEQKSAIAAQLKAVLPGLGSELPRG